MSQYLQAPYRQIRATYDDDTITVYQAYKRSIADAAVKTQKLDASPDFRPGRMTWVKPSWSWMMYRAGYSFKDPGQERILALKMKHEHFTALLERGVLSTHHGPGQSPSQVSLPAGDTRDKASEVRIQWDPERSPKLEVLPYRSIQIGIPGSLCPMWTNNWIMAIEDVTHRARSLKEALDERQDISMEELMERGLVPTERPYVVSDDLSRVLEMDSPPRIQKDLH